MADAKIEVGFEKDRKALEVAVPDGEPVPWDLRTELRTAGTRVPRLDGPVKADGRATYTHDVNLPGMLHGRILRSPHARARIRSIDDSRARTLDGVKATWTTNQTEVVFAGQEIAAVAATTHERAGDAMARIAVDYEVLPHAVDVEDAMADGAPAVLPRGPNIREDRARRRGDPDEAFAAATKVVEANFRTRVQTHACLETHGAVCAWKDGELTIHASTQGTFRVRDMLARRFRMPAGEVRVLTPHMGGGFGSKLGAGNEIAIGAELARSADAPVKLVCERAGEHLATGNRPDSIQRMKLGVDGEGTITALRAISHGTGGCRLGGAACRNDVIYDFPNVEKRTFQVATNCGPAAPMRAPGWPQGVFALESIVDMAAHAIGMDPLAFRDRNDPDPVRREQRRIAAETIGWNRRRGGKAPDGPVVRGLGYGSGAWFNLGRPPAEVLCEIGNDGSVLLANGAQDIGTGTRTVMAVVAAEELGLEPGAIAVRLGDTRDGVGPASGGSTTVPSLMPAVRSAAFSAKRELLALVAAGLETDAADLDLRAGRVVRKDGKPGPTWKEACAAIEGDKLTGIGRRRPNFAAYRPGVAGCQIAEVEVDVETGQVRVVKVVAVHDCGQPLDRLTLESQVNGAVIQGTSYALHEERVMDRRTGRMLNANLETYKIAGSLDVPEIDVTIFPVAAGANNLGSAGIGEPPVIPTAAAIANAVFDATGARCLELPMTPMRVLEALERREEGR